MKNESIKINNSIQEVSINVNNFQTKLKTKQLRGFISKIYNLSSKTQNNYIENSRMAKRVCNDLPISA